MAADVNTGAQSINTERASSKSRVQTYKVRMPKWRLDTVIATLTDLYQDEQLNEVDSVNLCCVVNDVIRWSVPTEYLSVTSKFFTKLLIIINYVI